MVVDTKYIPQVDDRGHLAPADVELFTDLVRSSFSLQNSYGESRPPEQNDFRVFDSKIAPVLNCALSFLGQLNFDEKQIRPEDVGAAIDFLVRQRELLDLGQMPRILYPFISSSQQQTGRAYMRLISLRSDYAKSYESLPPEAALHCRQALLVHEIVHATSLIRPPLGVPFGIEKNGVILDTGLSRLVSLSDPEANHNRGAVWEELAAEGMSQRYLECMGYKPHLTSSKFELSLGADHKTEARMLARLARILKQVNPSAEHKGDVISGSIDSVYHDFARGAGSVAAKPSCYGRFIVAAWTMALEIFPNFSPAEARAEFLNALYEAHVESSELKIQRLVDSALGGGSYLFVALLNPYGEEAFSSSAFKSKDATISEILMSSYVMAANLPEKQRLGVRRELRQLLVDLMPESAKNIYGNF